MSRFACRCELKADESNIRKEFTIRMSSCPLRYLFDRSDTDRVIARRIASRSSHKADETWTLMNPGRGG